MDTIEPQKTTKATKYMPFIRVCVLLAAILVGVVIIKGNVLQPGTNAQSPDLSAGRLANPITDGVAYYDTFDNRQLSGWVASDDANWTVTDEGVLRGQSTTSDDTDQKNAVEKPGTYMVAGNTDWDDFEYTLRIETNENNAAGTLFRYVDDNNYYQFTIDKESGYVRLVKKIDGVYSLLQNKIYTYPIGRSIDLKITVVGSSIRVTLDNAVVFDVTDTSLLKGKIGVYSRGTDPAFFDDVAVKASLPGSFTIALLPDTQYYPQRDPEIFTAQTKWIAENRWQKNIAFVLHEGDIVNDICEDQEWQRASESLSVLDGKVPYAFAAGNHELLSYDACALQPDYPPDVLDTDKLREYFPVSRYQENPTFGGVITENLPNLPPGVTTGMTNSYHLFSAGGVDFVVISLRYGPSDSLLATARLIANRYPERKVILLTHDYLSEKGQHRGTTADGSRCTANPLKTPTANILCTPTNLLMDGPYTGEDWALPSLEGMNSGVEMWDEFVKKQSNVAFVVSGHVAVGQNADSNSGLLISDRKDGSKVYQMVANYQLYGASGGEGYLRLMTFYPSLKRVDVSTYSPYLETELTDASNKFTLLDVDL